MIEDNTKGICNLEDMSFIKMGYNVGNDLERSVTEGSMLLNCDFRNFVVNISAG